MKNIIIVRHAKSDWSNLYLQDFDRELNERGLTDAPMMGERLIKKNIVVEHILSSSARRAVQTAQAIATEIGTKLNSIEYCQALYHASSETIANHIMTIDYAIKSVLIICHNPGITHFVNSQCGTITDNVPTCGMAAFEIDINEWAEFLVGTKKLLFYDFPKK